MMLGMEPRCVGGCNSVELGELLSGFLSPFFLPSAGADLLTDFSLFALSYSLFIFPFTCACMCISIGGPGITEIPGL